MDEVEREKKISGETVKSDEGTERRKTVNLTAKGGGNVREADRFLC